LCTHQQIDNSETIWKKLKVDCPTGVRQRAGRQRRRQESTIAGFGYDDVIYQEYPKDHLDGYVLNAGSNRCVG
jgi:hypothetical protein